jgi:hypothetical protein
MGYAGEARVGGLSGSAPEGNQNSTLMKVSTSAKPDRR